MNGGLLAALMLLGAPAEAPDDPRPLISSLDGAFIFQSTPETIMLADKPELLLWPYGAFHGGAPSFVAFSNSTCEVLYTPPADRRELPVRYHDYGITMDESGTVDIHVNYTLPGSADQRYTEHYAYDGTSIRLRGEATYGGKADPVWRPGCVLPEKAPDLPLVETEGHPSPQVDIRVGDGGEPVLLNRSKTISQHESYFFPDPTRTSGVIVFGDDAAGTSIGVVATCPQGDGTAPSPWQLHDRFWQEANWGRNVTSFAWSPDGRYLFVSTSDIYGTGDFYQLDLHSRKATVLFPDVIDESLAGHCWSGQIERVTEDTVTIHVRDYCENDRIFIRKTVPFPADLPTKQELPTAPADK